MAWSKKTPDALQISAMTDENEPEEVIHEVHERKSALVYSDTVGCSSGVPFIKNPRTLEGVLELKEKNQASNETVTCALIETENAAKLENKKLSDDYLKEF